MHGDPDDRPVLAPVRAPTGVGPRQIMAAIVVAVGVVTFAAGYRLGSAPSPVAPSPLVSAAPGVTLAPSVTPAPSPDFQPVSPDFQPVSPDFQPVAVSQRLRGAISAAGTGDFTETSGGSPPWVVCAVDAAPRCGPLAFETLDRAYSDIAYGTADDWAGLTPVTVTGRHFLLAAVLEETVVGAILVRLDNDSNPLDSRLLQPVDPDQRGIDFVDLGVLEPGRYIVAAGGLSPTILYGAPGVAPTLIPLESRSDVAALIVTAGAP